MNPYATRSQQRKEEEEQLKRSPYKRIHKGKRSRGEKVVVPPIFGVIVSPRPSTSRAAAENFGAEQEDNPEHEIPDLEGLDVATTAKRPRHVSPVSASVPAQQVNAPVTVQIPEPAIEAPPPGQFFSYIFFSNF